MDPVKRILGKGLGMPKFGKRTKYDWDGDGIPNRKDCQPRNPARQDYIMINEPPVEHSMVVEDQIILPEGVPPTKDGVKRSGVEPNHYQNVVSWMSKRYPKHNLVRYMPTLVSVRKAKPGEALNDNSYILKINYKVLLSKPVRWEV
jgi:hypothetical protein